MLYCFNYRRPLCRRQKTCYFLKRYPLFCVAQTPCLECLLFLVADTIYSSFLFFLPAFRFFFFSTRCWNFWKHFNYITYITYQENRARTGVQWYLLLFEKKKKKAATPAPSTTMPFCASVPCILWWFFEQVYQWSEKTHGQ